MMGLWALLAVTLLAVPTTAIDAIQFVDGPAPPFVTRTGRTARKYLPETMGGGVAVFDYNNDGLMDIYAVNGASMPNLVKDGPQYSDRLFRNNGDGTFSDVTEQAGLTGKGFNIGVAIGDYDNDGDEDIFVAGVGHNTLYHNNGDGTFTDVTERSGLAHADPQYGSLWAVGAAWVDYDRDGLLDLFVANYVLWDAKTEPVCEKGGLPDFCYPRAYMGAPNSLFRNNGDGTFSDVSAASGVRQSIGKGMAVAAADFDGDGWPDLFVSNDTLPNSLFLNQRNGTFKEAAIERGVAFTENGAAISGMGVDARDIDNDGRPDIFETALQNETMPLFRNLGQIGFEEVTFASGVAHASLPKTGWSNGIYDFNNDGRKDLFAACGHVMDAEGSLRATVPQTNIVFANLGDGKFADVTAAAGEALVRKGVHRGASFGDLDNDGRVDVVVTELDGPLRILRNVSPSGNHWLLVRTIGTKSNRDGIGTRIRAVTEDGVQYNAVATSVGYASSSDVRVHFGLGRRVLVRELELFWPSGSHQVLKNVKADQVLTVREP
ncbi:MAG TPA: CRTAC1 family protein [Candidatus Acidoferrum sp.]|nr:CRTAC1 family protein [Candidatus Acidoferrum sp.]